MRPSSLRSTPRLSSFAVAVLVVVMIAACPHALRADEVTDWNQTMLRAGLVGRTPPLDMTRVAAIVQAAIFDAANGFDRRYYYIYMDDATESAPAGASRRAAIAQAAHDAILALYPLATFPTIKGTVDARLAVAMASIAKQEGTTAIALGVAWGKAVAERVLAKRATDGFTDPATPAASGSLAIGAWRPEPPSTAPGVGSQFADMTPWILSMPDQFHPPVPPLIGERQYADELTEVRLKGRNIGSTRTLDETIFSWFWASSTATYLWNKVALSLLDGNDKDESGWNYGEGNGGNGYHTRSLLENARLLAMLDLAMADAAIGCWEAKYDYLKWRPISAIRIPVGGDPDWLPLFTTPNHPEYPSGHSCVSGAAAAVLREEFGEKTRFTIESDTMLGVTRSFKSFTAALKEVANARIYAGIHFRSACTEGQILGAKVAEYVMEWAMKRRYGSH